MCYYVMEYYQEYGRLRSYHKMSITKWEILSKVVSPLIDTPYSGNTHHLNSQMQTQSSIKNY